MSKVNKIAVVMGVFLVSASAAQADWPQYLGPDRNASAPQAELARSWPEGGPEQMWSVPLGLGYGGASVQGGEVFVLDRMGTEADILRCISLESGKEQWAFRYDAPGEHSYPGSRAVPTVDEDYVWIVGPFGHLHCVSRETHQAVWKTNILDQFNAEKPGWGVAQSPLIYKDLVIVAPQGEKAGVVAYDKKTGELRWASRKLSGKPCHVSPALAHFGGVDQVVMVSPYDQENEAIQNEVVGIDASNGEVLWSYDGLRSFATIAPPTIVDDNRLFLTDGSYNDGYNSVSIMVDVQRDGEIFTVTEIFKTEEVGGKLHPAVLHDGYLYLNSGRRGTMQCLSLDGNVMWSKSSNFSLGALMVADGLLLNQNGKNGDVHLIEATPEGYHELAKAELFSAKENKPWAPLAFSNGKLLIRDSEKMICLDISQH
jgi:outer membrane protein assembly factor BamB